MNPAVSRKDYIMTWSNTVTCCNGWWNFWLFCSANKKAPAVGAAGADVLERNQWLRLHWPVASLLCPFLRIFQAGVCHAFSRRFYIYHGDFAAVHGLDASKGRVNGMEGVFHFAGFRVFPADLFFERYPAFSSLVGGGMLDFGWSLTSFLPVAVLTRYCAYR